MSDHPKSVLSQWAQKNKQPLPQYVDFLLPGNAPHEPQFTAEVHVGGKIFGSAQAYAQKKQAQGDAATVALDFLTNGESIEPSKPRALPIPAYMEYPVNLTENLYVFMDCDNCGDVWKALFAAPRKPNAEYRGYANMRLRGKLPVDDQMFTMTYSKTMKRDVAEWILARDVWEVVFRRVQRGDCNPVKFIIVSNDAAVENLVDLLQEKGFEAHFVCSLDGFYGACDDSPV